MWTPGILTCSSEARLCVAGDGVHEELRIVAAADKDGVLIWQARHAQRAHIMAVRPLGLGVHPPLGLACRQGQQEIMGVQKGIREVQLCSQNPVRQQARTEAALGQERYLA